MLLENMAGQPTPRPGHVPPSEIAAIAGLLREANVQQALNKAGYFWGEQVD